MMRYFILTTLVFISTLSAKKLPNVIILYADDMGVADVSYGDEDAPIQTPFLDQLAREGMTFTDGHSSSGICTPSRYALLTGQHHWRKFHGIVNAFEESVFEEGEFTLARMFGSKGYETGCFGKWHLGWDWKSMQVDGFDVKKKALAESYDWTRPFRGGPLDQGFDYYHGDGTINFPPYCWIENDKILTPPTKPVIKSNPLAGGGGFRKGPMAEDWDPYKVLPTMTEKTVEWIKGREDDKPFFAYLAFNSPHYPIVPNKEFHGKSKAGYYGDFVVETDAMVGKVMKALEEKGIAENTIVIFTADNGAETHAFERLQKYKQWSSGAFRGLKRDIYEGGHRVPFIVRWPSGISAGTTTEEVVSQVDLAATFAEIIGYELKGEEARDSYNLLPVWKEEEYEKPLRTATVQNTSPGQYALRQGDWVLINSHTGGTKEPQAYLNRFNLTTFPENSPGLLFNLREDPRQSQNLYADHPERVSEMTQLLQSYLDGTPCAPRLSRE